jgi:RNA polymerase sigma-70 factor, ECF subfamily
MTSPWPGRYSPRARRQRATEAVSVVEDSISDEFVRKHYAGLRSLLLRRIRDAAVVTELLNEAFSTAIVHMRAGRIAEPDKMAGYVYRVAMNLYRNYRREFNNRVDLRAAPDEIDRVPAADGLVDGLDSGVLQAIRSIITSLPAPRDREVLKRFYLDEEEKDAICHSLGLTAMHFDRVISRARQRMRALLEAQGFRKPDIFSVALLVCCA